jgi:hypothetical protein
MSMIIDNKFKIMFEKDNANVLRIVDSETGKIVTMISLPPIDYGTDIINIDHLTTLSGYEFNFKGLVLITNPHERKLFYMGHEICSTKRKPTMSTKEMFDELLADDKKKPIEFIIEDNNKSTGFTIVGDNVHYNDDKKK